MNNIISILFLTTLMIGCSKSDDAKIDGQQVWNGVFYDAVLDEDVHDPKVNYSLIIEGSDNFEIIPPTESVDGKITAIEILNADEMNLTWQIGNETHVVKADYSFQNNNELVISKFIYTLTQIPFPNNLISGKFIKETKNNNL